LRYATGLLRVLRQGSSFDRQVERKPTGNLETINKADGKDVALEADQIAPTTSADDPNAIALRSLHPKFPADVKILDVGATDAGPCILPTRLGEPARTIPIPYGAAVLWIDIEPGKKVDPQRFVSSSASC